MAYTRKELKKIKKALNEVTKYGEDLQKQIQVMQDNIKVHQDRLQKNLDELEEYQKKWTAEKDAKYMELCGMTFKEYGLAHKEEINEYMLSHPEDFPNDDPTPFLIGEETTPYFYE